MTGRSQRHTTGLTAQHLTNQVVRVSKSYRTPLGEARIPCSLGQDFPGWLPAPSVRHPSYLRELHIMRTKSTRIQSTSRGLAPGSARSQGGPHTDQSTHRVCAREWEVSPGANHPPFTAL